MNRLLRYMTIFLAAAVASDQIPAPPQTHPILLSNATIHPVTSKVIKRGDILFEKGVITAMGRRIGILPDNTETIDLAGVWGWACGPSRFAFVLRSCSAVGSGILYIYQS